MLLLPRLEAALWVPLAAIGTKFHFGWDRWPC
jgi:hypothetical protein